MGRKQPIKVKLILIIMLTSILCLLLTGVTVIIYERQQTKKDLVNDLSALGLLIADRKTRHHDVSRFPACHGKRFVTSR